MPAGAGRLSAAAADWAGRDFLEHDQEHAPQVGRLGQRPDREVDGRKAAVGLDPHAAVGDGGLLFRGVVDGDAQLFAEPLAGHRKDVDVDLPRRRFQVLSGPPVDVDDVALRRDHHGGRAVRIQQHPLGRVENVHDRFLGFLGWQAPRRARGATRRPAFPAGLARSLAGVERPSTWGPTARTGGPGRRCSRPCPGSSRPPGFRA